MSRHNQIFFVVVLLACIVGFYRVSSLRSTTPQMPSISAGSVSMTDIDLPDFSVYPDVVEKKTAFFKFIYPLVEQENRRLLAVRQYLLELQENGIEYSEQEEWLEKLAKRYRLPEDIKDEDVITELLLRVDEIPPSLALVQSANESAWGSSRFARKGNNLFGQWCFREGCGMVPSSRSAGATHEVATFSNPRKSVESYIHNLNTNAAYDDFRKLRAGQREQQAQLSGKFLAQGLLKYSTRGEEYVKELQAMIRVNKLDQYDVL